MEQSSETFSFKKFKVIASTAHTLFFLKKKRFSREPCESFCRSNLTILCINMLKQTLYQSLVVTSGMKYIKKEGDLEQTPEAPPGPANLEN